MGDLFARSLLPGPLGASGHGETGRLAVLGAGLQVVPAGGQDVVDVRKVVDEAVFEKYILMHFKGF